jgi:hypothetical protein
MNANRSYGHGTAILMAIAMLASGTALGAAPIPPAELTFDVSQVSTVVHGCKPNPTSQGGHCGSEKSGPGFAATSGGIGTASYLAVTPGGKVLGTGTAVDALSNWTSGGAIRSSATMTYSFEATGPSSVNFIPVDVISKGLVDLVGNSNASLSLMVLDQQEPDRNIPQGISDPDPPGPLLDLSAKCSHGECSFDSWGNAPVNELTNLLCVVNGDDYVLTIQATTAAAPGHGTRNSASAVLDPVIKIDPPTPSNCPITVDPHLLRVTTGPGASTGVGVSSGVPEPSTLSLAAFAAIGLAFATLRRRTPVRSSSQR